MKLSIRFKLLIGFTLLVGLSLLIQAFAFFLTRDYIATQIKGTHLEKSQDAAGAIVEMFADIQMHSDELARIYTADGDAHDHSEFSVFAGHILSMNDTINKVSILSLTGREIYRFDKSGEVSAEKLNIELPSNEFDLAKKGSRGISKVYYLENTRSPHIDAFFPIQGLDRKVSGVVKMQISLGKLWGVIAHSTLGEQGFAYVVDQDGVLIAHPDSEYLAKRPNLSNRKFIPILLNHLGQTLSEDDYLYVNEQGEEAIAQGTEVAGINWLVVFEQPVSEAYAFLQYIQSIFLFTLVGSLILLFLIALFISDNLTRPIRVLQRATNMLTKGHLETRITLKTHDELEELANSFNVMAASMQDAFLNLAQDRNLLSAERNKMEVAFSGIVDGVVVVDLDRKISIINKAAQRLTGYGQDDVIGKSIGQVLRVYEKEKELIAPTYCPIRTDDFEGTLYTGDGVTVIGKDGKTSHINLMAGKIREGSKVNVGTILVMHDVDREKQLEDMKLDFVSMAAHELRTPLTTVRGYLAVLLGEETENLRDEQKTFLERISIASDQLLALVENLLNITRIEKGALTLNLQEFEWDGIVKKVVNDLMSRAEQKKIAVTYREPLQALPLVSVDVFRISEVVTNLLANAINYTAPGGSVTIMIEQVDNTIITHISDTGEGIPNEAIPHLFTKFFRVSGKLEQGSKGTGLGLYISKAIVDMHHGKIWVESTVGKGSTFSFSLPIKQNG